MDYCCGDDIDKWVNLMNEEQKTRERPEKKQLAFCREYVKDFNGAQSAKRAGYIGHGDTLAVTASRLLRSDKVKNEIADLLQSKCMQVDEALMRLAEQARGIQSRYIGPDGKLDIAGLVRDDCAHLIKKLKYKDEQLADIEFYDAQVALEKILKAGGAYQGKGEAPLISVAFDLGAWAVARQSRLDEIAQLDDGETPNA